jgi:hypothetical protein
VRPIDRESRNNDISVIPRRNDHESSCRHGRLRVRRRTGSFTGAARQLGLEQPAITKMVAQLDEREGFKLLRVDILVANGLEFDLLTGGKPTNAQERLEQLKLEHAKRGQTIVVTLGAKVRSQSDPARSGKRKDRRSHQSISSAPETQFCGFLSSRLDQGLDFPVAHRVGGRFTWLNSQWKLCEPAQLCLESNSGTLWPTQVAPFSTEYSSTPSLRKIIYKK